MRVLSILSLLVIGTDTVLALVTLETIRNLTTITNECLERVIDSGELASRDENRGGGAMKWLGQGPGEQAVFEALVVDGVRIGDGAGDGDQVEATVSATLRILAADLLHELEKPLDASFQETPQYNCPSTIGEFHSFIAATTKFLHSIQERQMFWRWDHQSPVFDSVAWLQALWASRKANIQHRSFIEQQMVLYSDTGCFGQSQEVLRRDVEIVEYMNDLIDSF
ncbi:hypothetical protein F5884DRAFT_762608 [Xylogone sp. PMI_703]|nr:hypothetical protein F5884DRAFT_762608 [Xylogone sp. PMI_703]